AAWPHDAGRYRLLAKLGEGGMGTVWRARDESDGTTVAIKELRAEMSADSNALRRLHKEARLLAEVQHPYVANLLEVNEDQGVHFMVLELWDGPSLAKVLEQRGRFDEPTALSIITDVARALVEAHERGIVHRDIKPGNILLLGTAEGSNLRAKLSDFGLAR